MSLGIAPFAVACVIVVLAALAAAVRAQYLRQASRSERAPESGTVRALYSIAAPILAFAIVAALIILFIAGPCGLEYGYAVGTIVLLLGYGLIPLCAAALAFGLSRKYGRHVVLVESAMAVICTVVLIVYGFSPHQPAPTTYDPSNRCSFGGI